MSDPIPPEQPEEQPKETWRLLTSEMVVTFGDSEMGKRMALNDRYAALLAAEDEHPATAEIDRLRQELDETIDDLTLSLRVRNAALEQAALDYMPGPDGQDYLDRSRQVLRWIEAAYEELEIDAPLFPDPPVVPKPSLLASAAPVDEHPPTFHVIEGERLWQPGDATPKFLPTKHWHVNWVASNGQPVWNTENYTDRSWAIRTAHEAADRIPGARVIDHATGEEL